MPRLLRTFESAPALTDALCRLIESTMAEAAAAAPPRALMLPGGGTPLEVYRRLTASPPTVPMQQYFLLSDDRFEPDDQPTSNFHHIHPMLEAAGVPEQRVYHLDKSLTLEESARRYEVELAAYLAEGGTIPLGLLGLGGDGHTAALFTMDHLEAARDRLVMPLQRPDRMEGVTVTPAFLGAVDRIVFMVTGANKQDAVRAFLEQPDTITAGVAVRAVDRVEIWADRAANPFDGPSPFDAPEDAED